MTSDRIDRLSMCVKNQKKRSNFGAVGSKYRKYRELIYLAPTEYDLSDPHYKLAAVRPTETVTELFLCGNADSGTRPKI